MKKIIMSLAACALVVLGSCSNNKNDNNAAAEAAEAATDTTAVAAETPAAPADYISQLQAQDSTVQVTPSGLGYRIIKETRGVRPDQSSTVKVKYTGKHTDGTVFDSSNGEAVTFPLGQVIPGFREGIALMPQGSTFELYIPADLGYGQQGVPQAGIQPGETLVFEVELVEIL